MFRSMVLELRASSDGRTLIGRAVPYGETATIGSGTERFMPGAFAAQLRSGNVGQVKIYASHSDRMDGQHPIGKTASLSEQPDGLYGEWPIYDTTRGEDALALVKAGEVTGLSVGFKPLPPGGIAKAADGALEIRSARLDHVALTHEPVYAGAGVTAVRSFARAVGTYRLYQARAWQIAQRVSVR